MSNTTADGRLHRYWPERNLTLFEYQPSGDATWYNLAGANTLIFISGLGGSFVSVPYVPLLASYIHQVPNWSLMEIQLSSSGVGWGTADLCQDVEEIGKAVEYLRGSTANSNADTAVTSRTGKIVLMGLSTGCQDVLHYLYHNPEQKRPPVDGAILQAAVSDREGLVMMCERDEHVQRAFEECLRISLESQTEDSKGKISTLPPETTSLVGWPRGLVSCKRFLSLVSPSSPERPSDDDLFSSDLSDETLSKTFGAVAKSGRLTPSRLCGISILVTLSAEDEYTPPTVNKGALIKRWAAALENGHATMAPPSGVIAKASHAIKEHAAQFDLVYRVLRYLELSIGGVKEETFLKLEEKLELLDSQNPSI
ncbi:hypothetical protein GJ744_003849 [Endocarpon pusillum]|uniref:Uncharacterized protein n=1 Tax=Endocarpon pusillum TaxID=364733 RepID=A0A8H7ARG2_9EURO|nr:hypothetical protein GJ744_003849 [Endocarpon pusillum]